MISELDPRSIEQHLRLACQARFEGDGDGGVEKVGVRRPDILLGLTTKGDDE